MKTRCLVTENPLHSLIVILLSLLVATAIQLTFIRSLHAAQVSLAWEPGQDTSEIAGYKVYYGTSSGSYTHVLNIGNHTSCDISGLIEGNIYFFAASAYDGYGNESDKSGEITYIAGKSPKPDKKQMAAVMNIITTMLLNDN
jgi:hypothetical protein